MSPPVALRNPPPRDVIGGGGVRYWCALPQLLSFTPLSQPTALRLEALTVNEFRVAGMGGMRG